MATNTTTNTPYSPSQEYIPYDSDHDYEGAGSVVEEEFSYIHHRRAWLQARRGNPAGPPPPYAPNRQRPPNLTGLALSGGGIRSASFSIGVMQALAEKGVLERFDYLSTVSGGGYAGSSLTWLLQKQWRDDRGEIIPMGLGRDDLAFGTRWRPADGKDSENPTSKRSSTRSVLRHLRQNANYLLPGHGITWGSMLAVVLRGTLVSAAIYLCYLSATFIAIGGSHLLAAKSLKILGLAGISLLLFGLFSVCYAVATCSDSGRYENRRKFESSVKFLLYFALAAVILALLPISQELLARALEYFRLSGGFFEDGITGALGVISTIGGMVFGIFSFFASKKRGNTGAAIGAALLLFGLLYGAYFLAGILSPSSDRWSLPTALAIGGAALLLAFFTNINYLSLHRFYRDRLMETFMPDVGKVVNSEGYQADSAKEADRTALAAMCPVDYPLAPYHLINCNVIILESKIAKFHGRGGDSFILSPKYCGSNATGWRTTPTFMEGQMTLPTAMAISGAAVNPGAGCGGEGVTRQPLLSMLLTFLNIRLGYAAPHPKVERPEWWCKRPNFLYPGFRDLFLRWKVTEQSAMIQLSDGGHFDNFGIYELLRRRLKLIVVVDAGADPDFTFSELANAMEKALVDFGAFVHIRGEQLAPLIHKQGGLPAGEGLAERGYLIADISYNQSKGDQQSGKLVYLTTTFTKNLTADLYGYRKGHPEFPDEPTSDQFFDEKQFEAYRELGFQLTFEMLKDLQQGKVQRGAVELRNLLGLARSMPIG